MNIYQVQQTLKTLGFYNDDVDGLHGPNTIKAIKAFQRSKSLVESGVLDPKTAKLLGATPRAVVSPAGVDFVKAWEGIEDGNPATVLLEPYICPARVVTIGWGHAIKRRDGSLIRATSLKDRAALAEGTRELQRLFGKAALTRDECKSLLSSDLNEFAEAVARQLQRPATQAQFDAMTSFAFNVGLGNFDKSSLLRFHNRGMTVSSGGINVAMLKVNTQRKVTPATIADAFCAYSRGGGQFLAGLFKRRIAEVLVYRGDNPATSIRFAQNLRV